MIIQMLQSCTLNMCSFIQFKNTISLLMKSINLNHNILLLYYNCYKNTFKNIKKQASDGGTRVQANGG